MAQYTKRFTKRHIVNGYAAMGDSRKRPVYAGATVASSVHAAIERERAKAIRMANANKGKK